VLARRSVQGATCIASIVLGLNAQAQAVPGKATNAGSLPQLSPVTAKPSYVTSNRYGTGNADPRFLTTASQLISAVGLTTSLTALVTSSGSSKVERCEWTANDGRSWSATGGTVANSTCVFPSVALPPGTPLVLNVRAYNTAGCMESPQWLAVTVERDFPKLVDKGLGDGKTPVTIRRNATSEGISFSKPLSDETKSKIEAALSAAVDHAFSRFDWVSHAGSNAVILTLVGSSVYDIAFTRDVVVDLVDRVGNTTRSVKVVDVP
jgi:hypothetical protein